MDHQFSYYDRFGRKVTMPTGLAVMMAIGYALMSSGDVLEERAIGRGEVVSHEVTPAMGMAAWGAAGAGVLVLLVGAGLAYQAWASEEDDDDVPRRVPRRDAGIDI